MQLDLLGFDMLFRHLGLHSQKQERAMRLRDHAHAAIGRLDKQ